MSACKQTHKYFISLSLCCVYLAFKIEEYNVTLDEFVYVLAPELRQTVADIVLTNEVSK